MQLPDLFRSFDALPEPARDYVYRRLLEVLSGRDQDPAFARLSAPDRQAILEILLATKRGLPDEWKDARLARRDACTERPEAGCSGFAAVSLT